MAVVTLGGATPGQDSGLPGIIDVVLAQARLRGGRSMKEFRWWRALAALAVGLTFGYSATKAWIEAEPARARGQ
jgi:hypothetical protein